MASKISILCPSFNHEKFVGFFIESVLRQSFEDFELIIVDDCSSDDNVREIAKFKDERIKLIQHEYNKGINAALNTAFENSNGDLIVFCASDDIFEDNALERLYHHALENPNILAFVPNTRVIDRDNQITSKEAYLKLRTRSELINQFFMMENCLSSVGLTMRREVFSNILYPLDMSMCNHQDTQMFIKILKNGEIKLIDEFLIRYRFDPKTSNISVRTERTMKREEMESYMLMETFLEFEDMALLEKAFANEIGEFNVKPEKENLRYFLGLMALKSPILIRKYWGYHKIMQSVSANLPILHKNYGFDFKQYLALIDHLEEKNTKRFMQYKKYKKISKISIILNFVIIFVFLIFIFLK
ncbi:glycosyltransferase family 2 protein [Campylobacter upsaliensis]|uniref:Glycosyltransferase family 2 protein n=1 Tax=Campylobacter upsaliensis TaxID=28080 RepID=A0A5L4DQV4_CAMUP|nr:glycosyltransferase family 2 protein [Campylobacter upsaliensis]EAH4720568.1 glycosyltransferase family 2 protein [Campylobacter upsaliensis]EAH5200635.1 glycosyltransferase family 2 protein [Campylobacter upsaliensis]EAH7597682.1 glycosyltransferase family 2 protein [Campylobacter upsaliensis]EAH8538582.1 glycosyltransferase family 2 protein [Campylobacter upsaliensis]EAI2137489.1 glycosyltransferase family 2 protein [Campylobacter upsaliensis]